MSKPSSFRPLLLVLCIGSSWLCAQNASAASILLVISQNGSLTSEESARRSQFQAWGHTVTTIWADESQAVLEAAASAVNLAYVPEEVMAPTLGTKLRYVSIGVIYEEFRLDDDFGISTSEGSVTSGTTVFVSGYGDLPFFNTAQPRTAIEGTISPAFQVYAKISSTGKIAAGFIEKGAALANTINGNSIALGRRIRLPFGGDSFQWSSLNGNGLGGVQQAIAIASVSSQSNQLILHWKLDEGSGTVINDASGYGINAAFQTGTPTWTSGPRDGALAFNRTNDARSSYNFDPPSKGSVAFWVRRNNISTSTERVFGNGENWEVGFYSNGRMFFDLGAGANDGAFDTYDVNTANKWYHVVAVYNSDADTYSLYLNGTKIKSGTAGLADQPSNFLSLGNRTGSSDRFDGTVDDFRVYNYELSDQEVATIYGLIGHWKFNEGTGTVAADSTAFQNDATINGATWTTDCAGNTALAFDGTGDQAATGSNVTPPSEGTVAFWFQSADPSAVHQRLWGVSGNFEMRQDVDGTLYPDLLVDAYVANTFSPPLPDPMVWHHIVATFDSDDETYAVYIDGELVKSGIADQPLNPEAANILTFGTRTGSLEYWQGAMRDFRLYNRKLLASEVSQLSQSLGHWKLDETSGSIAYDSSAAGRNAVYYGSPTLGVNSSNVDELGTAIDLNGSSQYVSPGSSLLNNLGQFTIAGWVYLDDDRSGTSFFGQNDVIEFGILYADAQLHLWTANGGELFVPNILNTGRWIHVAAVGDGTAISVYVNGTLVAMGGHSLASVGQTTYGTSSFPFGIGQGVFEGSGQYLDGRVDDVRIYSRPLCAEEIEALAAAGQVQGIRIIRWLEVK